MVQSRSRVWWIRAVLTTACCLVLAVEGVLLLRSLGSSRTATDASPGAGASRGGTGGSSPGSRAGSGGATDQAPLVPPPPPGLTGAGGLVRSKVLASGRIEVAQWIRSTSPITELTLGVASSLPEARASDIVVGGDGELALRAAPLGSESRTIRLPDPATVVYLSYVLDGMVDTSASVSGRALAMATSLDVDYEPDDVPVHVEVAGAGKVLNLACLRRNPSSSIPLPCGVSSAKGWEVDLAGSHRHDRVMAQLDLDAGVS